MKRNVAVIGAGPRGRDLARAFDRLEALRTVVPPAPDLAAVLADPEVRRVAVAVPAAARGRVTEAVLDSGRDVFVDAPLARDAAAAAELLHRAAGRVVMVGYALSYHPAVLKLRELAAGGELGRVERVLSRAESDGMSLALTMAGAAPTAASSDGASGVTRIEFAGGLAASVFRPHRPGTRLVVIGCSALATFDGTSLFVLPRREDRRCASAPAAHRSIGFVDQDPLPAACWHFLQACATRVPPQTDGRHGLDVLRIIAAAGESLRDGGRVVALDRPAEPRAPDAGVRAPVRPRPRPARPVLGIDPA